ncbi:MAG: hypothetical protein DDT22_00898 [candidate division WS2 bacterium]|nr:hypothetical protein [Candidatus Lithacetigena glycinireducens]
MPKIRSLTAISAKWADVTPRRDSYYRAGVESPKENWEEQAKAAGEAWGTGVSAAVADKRFEKGVAAAGQAKWREKTLLKGVTQGRWREGVAIARADYERGFSEYRNVIEGTVLTPRKAKGDPGNIDRVREIADALHNAKLAKYK